MAAPAIDYDRTARDFDSLDDRLWDLMLSVFPNLTDRDRNNTLNLLRWAFSDAGNNNDYYMSRLFRQAFVPTCTERKWMQILGRRTGYELGGVGAASVDLTITLQNGPLAGDVTIPAGTLIRTKDATAPVIGELQADVVITAGSTSATGSWRHAQSRTYTATSNGLADQEFYLPEGSYIDGSAAFSTVLGAWEEQDTLASPATGLTGRSLRLAASPSPTRLEGARPATSTRARSSACRPGSPIPSGRPRC